MQKLILIVSFLFVGLSFDAKAEFYISGGLAVHSPQIDSPEVNLKGFLGQVEAGYEHKDFTMYVQHTSAIYQYEKGYGLNTVGLKYTARFK